MAIGFPGLSTRLPGVGSERTATHRTVFKSSVGFELRVGGRIIDGSKSRDWGNTGNLDTLRAGLLMGMITASKKWAPSILGVTTGAYTSGGTTLTVSAAQAVEIARRVGTSGSSALKAIGPPSAAGTVAATAVTHSAINTSNGQITVSDLGVNKIAGTFITAADGSESPLTLIPDGWGVRVTDVTGTSQDCQFPRMPMAGELDSSQIIAWPSDTSLQAWIVAGISASGVGDFKFDHLTL